MKKWGWQSTDYQGGKTVIPKRTGAFTLSFGSDNRFSATTDCNTVAGGYTISNDKIKFSQMISTKMYCEGSEEAVLTKLLTDTEAYHFTSKGELILTLASTSGSAIFR
jgi:heat shock protein HslJ